MKKLFYLLLFFLFIHGITLSVNAMHNLNSLFGGLLFLVPVSLKTQAFLDCQLLNAAISGNEQVVQGLLDNGANPNAVDKNGNSALLLASRWNAVVVKYLLKRGAWPNMQYAIQGKTAIEWCILKGQTENLKFFIEAGANLDMLSSCGVSLLNTALKTKSKEIVNLLLRSGANPELWNKGGVFHSYRYLPGIRETEYELISQILQAEPTQANLYRAITQGHVALVKNLIFKVKPSIEQLNQVAIIVYQKYTETSDSTEKCLYKKIGILLRHYNITYKRMYKIVLDLVSQSALAFPEDITHYITQSTM
ncbi:ankyrin repeat domain-containing protein [Candidatus Dependentiae bacterium]|nr:ankyrin repeat domain-containing protein [Candidatus Dependentiae bacterium]